MLKYLLVILLQVPVWLSAQSVEALDKEYGFMGFKLAQNLDSLKGFRYKTRYMKKDVFVRDSMPLEYAGVKFSAVSFIFYKKLLHSIIIKTEGANQSQNLLDLLQLYYGEGVQDGMAPRFIWNGKKVYMVFDQNLLTKNAELVIESKAVQNYFAHDMQARFGE
jgi:hypothetical protein